MKLRSNMLRTTILHLVRHPYLLVAAIATVPCAVMEGCWQEPAGGGDEFGVMTSQGLELR